MYGFLCYSFQPMICISFNKTKNLHIKKCICIYIYTLILIVRLLHIMIQYFLLHARRKTAIFRELHQYLTPNKI